MKPDLAAALAPLDQFSARVSALMNGRGAPYVITRRYKLGQQRLFIRPNGGSADGVEVTDLSDLGAARVAQSLRFELDIIDSRRVANAAANSAEAARRNKADYTGRRGVLGGIKED